MRKPFKQLWVLLLLYLSWWNDFGFLLSLRLRLFTLHHVFAQFCKLLLRFACFSSGYTNWRCCCRHLSWQSLILFQLYHLRRLLLLEHHLQVLGLLIENFDDCTFGPVTLNFGFTFLFNDRLSSLHWYNTRGVFCLDGDGFNDRVDFALGNGVEFLLY